MVIIFDGKKEAEKILSKIKKEIGDKKTKPHLASIVVGENPGGMFYQNLKKKAAESVGATLEIIRFPESEYKDTLLALIKNLNTDNDVSGIMVQLPLPDKYNRSDRNEVIKAIAKEKDVDGMRLDSPFTAPVVLACDHALSMALNLLPCKDAPCKVAVVGAKGFVGERMMRYFLNQFVIPGPDPESMMVSGFDKGDDLRKLKDYEAIIACTGQEYLIKGEMVKEGAILIDTGAPNAEFTDEVIEKAGFVTPVPGGIGPVTIAYLIANIIYGISR